jgi:hypothetical protein
LHLPFKLGCIFFHTVLLACRAYAVARILQLKQAGKLFLTVSLGVPAVQVNIGHQQVIAG